MNRRLRFWFATHFLANRPGVCWTAAVAWSIGSIPFRQMWGHNCYQWHKQGSPGGCYCGKWHEVLP